MKKFLIVALAVMSCWTVSNAKVNVTTPESTAPDGVEAVDLGLSVKWANVNVGAKKPSDFGTYFAWGETKPKNFYSWDSYQWSRGKTQFLTKYSTADRKTQLDPSDDSARANWGDEWRTPTEAEYEELVNPDNCKWEWTTKDGVNGYKVTGKKTGQSIFLPITGFRYYGGIQFRAIYGIYWTSSLYTNNPNKVWCLEFRFDDIAVHYGNFASNRFSGRCVRAVK